MDDIYLTVFSPDINLFEQSSKQALKESKNSSLNHFTTTFPHNLVLNSNFEWVVGIVSFSHPQVLYVSEDKENIDVIRFEIVDPIETKSYNLDKFANLIAFSIANPSYYTKQYLAEFYDKENYKNFDSADNKLKKHATDYKNDFLVPAWPTLIVARENLNDERWDLPHDFSFTFAMHKNYTLHQLLYNILEQTHNKLKEKIKDEYTKYVNEHTVTLEDHLFHVTRTFIIRLYNERVKFYSINQEGSHTFQRIFLVVETDLIHPVFFNNQLRQVVLTKLCKPLNHYDDSVVQPIKYYNIKKKIISSIKFSITNENFKKIQFVDDTTRICFVLHFKPIKNDF